MEQAESQLMAYGLLRRAHFTGGHVSAFVTRQGTLKVLEYQRRGKSSSQESNDLLKLETGVNNSTPLHRTGVKDTRKVADRPRCNC